jgi:hypothetical protein
MPNHFHLLHWNGPRHCTTESALFRFHILSLCGCQANELTRCDQGARRCRFHLLRPPQQTDLEVMSDSSSILFGGCTGSPLSLDRAPTGAGARFRSRAERSEWFVQYLREMRQLTSVSALRCRRPIRSVTGCCRSSPNAFRIRISVFHKSCAVADLPIRRETARQPRLERCDWSL